MNGQSKEHLYSSALISVIIPNWDGLHWLKICIPALQNQSFDQYEIIVVDNGSDDASCDWLSHNAPQVRVLKSDVNRGFAWAANEGIRNSVGKYVVLLNNDTKPSHNWLEILFRKAEELDRQKPGEFGCIASCLVNMDNPEIVDAAGDTWAWTGEARKCGHDQKVETCQHPKNILSACAAAALYWKPALDEVGLFDTSFVSYLEDIDISLRLQMAGYKVFYCPEAVVMHASHGSKIKNSTYVEYMTANRLRLLINNFPVWSIIKNLHSILWGQLYFLWAYKKPLSSFKGYARFFSTLNVNLANRRALKKIAKRSAQEIEAIISQH